MLSCLTQGARSKEAGKGESFSKEESQFRSELFWNWSWRRDESIEPIVRAPTLKPHVLVREDVKLPDADGMWDCTIRTILTIDGAKLVSQRRCFADQSPGQEWFTVFLLGRRVMEGAR